MNHQNKQSYETNMKRVKPLLLFLTTAFLALLFILTSTVSVDAQSNKRDKDAPPRTDYYSKDNWYGNFGKCFKVWKGGLRYSDESIGKIEEMGKGAQAGWRKGSGHFFSFTKLTLLTLLFWLWVATSGWINNDTQRQVDLHRVEWNYSSILIFPTAFVITLFLPVFWIGFPILVLSWLVPVMVYVHHRNTGLLAADKVMTPDHLWFLARRMMFMNVEPKKAAYETGSPIHLFAAGKNVSDEAKKGRTIAARNFSGFPHFKELVYQGIRRNAMMIRVESSLSQTNFFFFIDGVWIPIRDVFDQTSRRPVSPEEGQAMIAAMKVLVGGNTDEHNRRQGGEFLIQYDGKKKMDALLVSQGKGGAEEVLIQFQLLSLPFFTLEELGMMPDRQASLRKILNAERGLCVLSAASGQGLRTFTNVAFTVADRFTRDFVTVEDRQKPYMVIENVPLAAYDSAKKETPMTVLPDVFFKEPKVLLIRDMINLETLKLCCEEIQNDRLIVTTFRGVDSADTIMKMLRTGISPKLLADALTSVVTQRLIRRLCPKCKEAIPAQPEVLRRLGLNPQTTPTLYRKRVRPVVEPGQKDVYIPCSHCMEIGYWGRAGVYDVVNMTDEIRQIISTKPSADAIRRAAAKSGDRGYFIDGAQLVGAGITSFDELRRFMQAGQSNPPQGH